MTIINVSLGTEIQMWPIVGWLGAISLAYGIAKPLIPEPSFLVAAAIIAGAGMLGATLGKIASR